MKVQIEITLEGGLGNRIRVINSILNFIKDKNIIDYSVRIYWIVASDLRASFEDLFEPIDFVNVKNIKKGSIDFLAFKLRSYLIFNFGGQRINAFKNIKKIDVTQEFSCLERLFIRTVHQFYPITSNFVCFNNRVMNKVPKVAGKYVGVHIRQGDNFKAIENSPLFMFEGRMREILSSEPCVLFYLSTDSVMVKNMFREKFSNIIDSGVHDFSRNTLDGIVDAACDMIMLAKSEQIIGSYYSSFSEVASQFRGIPLTILRK